MADQGRWFKLWCISLNDQELENLTLENWARWVRLGVYVKEHGKEGKIRFRTPATALVTLLRVTDFEAAIEVLKMFPNCTTNVHHGERESTVTTVTPSTVTAEIEYKNWLKYQGDFSNDRVRKFRDKKRHAVTAQEEKRSRREVEEKLTPSSPSGEVRDLIDLFCAKLTDRLGEKPPTINGGVLGRFFKAALRSHPREDVERRMENWFKSTEPFVVSSGYSATLFTSKFPLLKGGPIHARKSTSFGSDFGAKAAPSKYAEVTENG